MRSTLAIGFVALLVPACLTGTGEITGVDDGVGSDGTGGGGGGGDGSGSNPTTPRVTGTVDKSMVATELGKTETVTLTITGANGFAGPVAITPSMMDGAAAAAGYTITANPTSVDLTTDGTAMVQLQVKVPTDPAALAPTLTLDLTSTAAVASVTSTFAVTNQITINIPAGTGAGAHSGLPAPNSPIRLRMGARVIFHNSDTIDHVIHADGGIPHENTALGLPGTDYSVVPSDSATWYCHDHEGSGTARPILLQ